MYKYLVRLEVKDSSITQYYIYTCDTILRKYERYYNGNAWFKVIQIGISNL